MNVALDPSRPLDRGLAADVARRIDAFCDRQVEVCAGIGPELAPVHDLARRLTAGGKRLRPAFAVWGYVAAAGLDPADPLLDPMLTAAASLDLLHVSALVHDDVMDGSDTRRGMAAAHKQFEGLHEGLVGDDSPAPETSAAGAFGRAGAILLGDLLLMWSVELLHAADLAGAGADADRVARAYRVVETMRTEVTCGQYLDVVAQARPLASGTGSAAETDRATALDEAGRVVEFKSARYTVQRPCQFGATVGGADAAALEALGDFGSAIGRAFQYRDDVLGVFGDERVTGKPAGDDLREGKRTVLIAHTWAGLSPREREDFAAGFGHPALEPDQVARLRGLITGSGALDRVETMIDEHAERARRVLAAAPITEPGRTALGALADAAVRREA